MIATTFDKRIWLRFCSHACKLYFIAQGDDMKIRVDDAARLFGSKANLARTLGIKPQALSGWGEFLPELRAFQLRELHPDKANFLMAQGSSK